MLRKRIRQGVTTLLGDKRYVHIDNGANVLGVAHVDVHPFIKKNRRYFVVRGKRVYSPSLDDRLGVYILLDLLPQMGVNVDVLLTTDEEIGRSTAGEFLPTKDYNWIFSFDRRGYDVVMYEYETRKYRELLHAHGFPVGFGSFSDISYMDHLGVAGFNFGAGYYNEHSMNCFVDLDGMLGQVELFREFWAMNRDVTMEHTARDYSYVYYGAGYRSRLRDTGYHDYGYGYDAETINVADEFFGDVEPAPSEWDIWRALDDGRAFYCTECDKIHDIRRRSLYFADVCTECAERVLDCWLSRDPHDDPFRDLPVALPMEPADFDKGGHDDDDSTEDGDDVSQN